MNFPIIERAIDNALETYGASHFCRPRGSHILGLAGTPDEGVMTVKMLRAATYEEVTNAVDPALRLGRCRYFQFQIPEGGREAAKQIGELEDADLEKVRLIRGLHGYELVLDGGATRATSIGHLVIGAAFNSNADPEQQPLVYTWFPGRILGALQPEIAVKLR